MGGWVCVEQIGHVKMGIKVTRDTATPWRQVSTQGHVPRQSKTFDSPPVYESTEGKPRLASMPPVDHDRCAWGLLAAAYADR